MHVILLYKWWHYHMIYIAKKDLHVIHCNLLPVKLIILASI